MTAPEHHKHCHGYYYYYYYYYWCWLPDMLRKWVPAVRTGETERTSTIVWHVVVSSWRRPATSATGTHNSAKYIGSKEYRHLYTFMHSLKIARWGTSNQWMSWWRMRLTPQSNFRVPVMTRAATSATASAFKTCCSFSDQIFGALATHALP